MNVNIDNNILIWYIGSMIGILRKTLLTTTLLLVFTSCYTIPTSTVAPNVDFSKYTTAIMPTIGSGSSVILTEADMKIQNALVSYGYNVTTDRRVDLRELDYGEISKIFLIEYSISSNTDESVCIISFTDALSDNLVATFRGSFGLGMNISGDQRGSVDSAIKQMLMVLPNRNIQ
jgi:hypothetical protein